MQGILFNERKTKLLRYVSKEAASSEGEMLPLNHVELVLVHTTPSGLEYRYACASAHAPSGLEYR
jgi:hypothetical protein